jgi:hypothetical protein
LIHVTSIVRLVNHVALCTRPLEARDWPTCRHARYRFLAVCWSVYGNGGTIASGIEWLLLVTIVVAILRAFVWMFTTLCRHLRDHQLHDLSRVNRRATDARSGGT